MTIKNLSGIIFLTNLMADGFKEKVFSSLEDARKSKQEVSVVVHADGNYFELYVVGFDKGEFGEYVSWSCDEFKEEEGLSDKVYQFVYEILSSRNPAERIFEINPNLLFTPYNE